MRWNIVGLHWSSRVSGSCKTKEDRDGDDD